MRGMTAVVQRLAAAHGPEVLTHLLALSPEDRAFRFGSAFNDYAVERYVGQLDFARDAIFGLSEDAQPLAGMAHLALRPEQRSAELGLSVAPGKRGRGYGYALLVISAAHACKTGLRRLYMHCLADNRPIIHLARKAGMTVVRQNCEADAHLALQPGGDEGVKATRTFSVLDWLAIMRGAWRLPREN
jgi:RimJ/RimL family protein N-acetyltransferase